jgi:hypothetical protein
MPGSPGARAFGNPANWVGRPPTPSPVALRPRLATGVLVRGCGSPALGDGSARRAGDWARCQSAHLRYARSDSP